MDSLYEYGSRAGFWRIHREFSQRGLPLTVFGVAMALARHPERLWRRSRPRITMGQPRLALDPLSAHGYRRGARASAKAVQVLTDLFGKPPTGWYTGRDSPNTRQLVVEHGGFDYDSDYYGDDLPFWSEVACSDGSQRPHLIVPYTLDANDMRFCHRPGFNTAEQFYTYLKDSFDVLYAEGETAPKMMSVGMHCRLLGRPGVSARCSVSLTISSSTTRCGSAPGSRSPTTGAKPIRIAGSLLPLSWPSPEGTAQSRLLHQFTRMYRDY